MEKFNHLYKIDCLRMGLHFSYVILGLAPTTVIF